MPSPPAPMPTGIAPVYSAKPIAKGVRLLQMVLPQGAVGGPLIITTIEVDPRAAKGVRVEAALGGDLVWGTDPTLGRENVSALTFRTGAVAAINASFFPFAGNPIGLHVQHGELVTEPASGRALFAVMKSGSTRFDALTYEGSVRGTDDISFPLDGLNRAPGKPEKNGAAKNELLLYTPIFFRATLPAKDRFETALRVSPALPLAAGRDITGTVTRTGEGGGLPLEMGAIVLSGSGTGADFLRRTAGTVGAKVTVRLEMRTPSGRSFDLSGVREAVTGGPQLITDGKILAVAGTEGFDNSFSTTLHPRSAVGTTPDGKILLVTVDGRQKGVSRGISLPELAQRMQQMGCTHALNLDGGGSTASSVGGLIVNSPSGSVERPVASMLVVYAPPLDSRSDPFPGQRTLDASSARTVHVGETLPLFSTASAPAVVVGSRDGIGYVTQADGQFHATRAGRGVVGWVIPGSKTPVRTIPITVLGAETSGEEGFTPALTLTPDPADPYRATLTLKVMNRDGALLVGERVNISVESGIGPVQTASVTTDNSGMARTVLTWNIGSLPPSRVVTISSSGNRFTAKKIRAEPLLIRP
ncbi:MAG: phosphodiester glycosidase family protein [Cytophagales bacterium]|nr:phosphodiester glycosidase family protein [Armatimonadota bacterium]